MSRAISEEYEKYTAGLALFDAVPVLLFLMTGIIVYSGYRSPLFLAGVISSFLGGACKVVWKMIVAVRKRNIVTLTGAFHILLPLGFALMLLSLVIDSVREITGGTPVSESTLGGFWHAVTMVPAAWCFAAGVAGMFIMGYLGSHLDKSAGASWIEEIVNTIAQLAFLAGVILVYLGTGYTAGAAAQAAAVSTDTVAVTETGQAYYFDGPGTESAMIFYPGARVKALSYAPLMMEIAEGGTDCWLCRMPVNFALFDKDLAHDIADGSESSGDAEADRYERWYLGGHSLGGAAAAMLAAEDEKTGRDWSGLILLAAYPVDKINIPVLSIYGSEDTVLDHDKYEKAETGGLWPEDFEEHVIDGGNHAQFGSYGSQEGDGNALISEGKQQKITSKIVLEWIN